MLKFVLASIVLLGLQTGLSQACHNGRKSIIEKYPYQVGVEIRQCNTCRLEEVCSGSLIGDDVALTMAHCVEGKEASQVKITAGAKELGASDGFLLNVSRIVIHDKYNASSKSNDIALLFLEEKVNGKSAKIKAISLASDWPTRGDQGVVTGWSEQPLPGSPWFLRESKMDYVDFHVCRKSFAAKELEDSLLCAGYMQKSADICKAQAGAPLVMNGQLVGLGLFEKSCDYKKKPGIFVSVPYYIEWIQSTMAAAHEESPNSRFMAIHAEGSATEPLLSTIRAESSTTSAESRTIIHESSTALAESSTVPAESSTTSAESGTIPAESSTTSAETSPTLAESSTVPAESSTTSAESGTIPAESSTIPAELNTDELSRDSTLKLIKSLSDRLQEIEKKIKV